MKIDRIQCLYRIPLLFIVSAWVTFAHANDAVIGLGGFDEHYEAFLGDYNGDGYTDIYIRQAPQIILIAAEVIIPIILPPPEKEFVLLQNGQAFSVAFNLNNFDFSGWPKADVDLVLGDFNIDALTDIYILGLQDIIPGAFDQIVFGNDGAASTPLSVRSVDPDFNQFFGEVHSWTQDEYYFENTAIANGWYDYEGEEQTGWWYISYIDLFYDFDNGSDFLDEDDDPEDQSNIPLYCEVYPLSCGFDTGVGAWLVYGTFLTNIEIVYDYSNFNSDARDFVEVLATIFGDAKVFSTSPEAVIIGDILSTVFGVPVLRDVLGNGGFVLGEESASENERAHDRFDGILWNMGMLSSLEEDEPDPCDDPNHLARVWGIFPIEQDAHYDRNQFQSLANSWTIESDIPKSGFEDPEKTGVHSIGLDYTNREYRGKWTSGNDYKGYQVIVDPDGNVVTDAVNGGTYDFEKSGGDSHLRRDVTPWLEWGNAANDTTTQETREGALFNPSSFGGFFRGRIAVMYMKNFYRCTEYLP